MPYTLTKGLLWFLLALLLGVVIGWLLRSIRATRQLRLARLARPDTDADSAQRGGERRSGEPTAVLEPAATDQVGVEQVGVEPVAPTGSHEPKPSEAVPVPAAGAPVASAPPTDDLTAIVGIDASVAELCDGIGIHTWRDLADTEVSLLRTMLADAGPRFAQQAPDTWPEQAALLAAGEWDQFRELAARLDGREPSA